MNYINSLSAEIISMISNILLFSSVPFIWYIIRNKSFKGFFQSIGIFKPKKFNSLEVIIMIVTVYIITLAANIIVIESGNSLRSSEGLEYTGISIVLSIIIYGLKTGIAEEIFFRGFIAKKLFSILGYKKGNLIQAAIFALPHFVINGSASYIDIIVRIINAFLLGYTFGYILEKKSNGSILPVMIAHILINITSSSILMLLYNN
ncbi:CPBP family intramembrane glutamic endopeptidase [Paenibacillus faecalis]|uniref:CPBP family intramembrane glutamic endopeptidase n=1 Tax=Paenibacillus faecalis TaxID=2079532 RepID=UPI00131A5E0C|nr:CPBP family intramembrane glutamic endopeptidase [Paenibacillus faecalis]